MFPNPASVYTHRLAMHRSTHARLERQDRWFAAARLGVFAFALAAGFAVWRADITPWLLLGPGVAFLVVIARHDRVIQTRRATERAIDYCEQRLARIQDRWMGTGEPGTRFCDAHHPYATDLDLFGPGSLFQLLSTARTEEGEAELASWLLAGADPDVIRARQTAVAELAPAVILREQMAVAGHTSRLVVDTGGVHDWADREPASGLRSMRLRTYVATAGAAAAAAWLAATGDMRPLGVVFAFQLSAYRADGRSVEAILQVASGKARDLDTFRQLLAIVETAAFSAPRLVALRRMLTDGPVPASRAIAGLQTLVERHQWGHSLRLVPVALFIYGRLDLALASAAAVLLLGPLLALAVERWRAAHGRHVGAWIAALAEIEAICGLASYHFEHPHDPFPVIEVGGSPPTAMFDGVGLGHPLLPAAETVRNDVRLADDVQVLVVSGSNMSGKSTLLRTVGVNAVLALAGAPVRAASLRISPLSIGATLRIQDSLQEGRSRFMAEITRIRELADLARGPRPLLFLLDELLHGTNSHDRRAGASGILRALLASGAVGLITTHDLALTVIADELAPHAQNIHFEERFEDGEMRFDYRVKAGPVVRSNALALMRAVGLQVPAGTAVTGGA